VVVGGQVVRRRDPALELRSRLAMAVAEEQYDDAATLVHMIASVIGSHTIAKLLHQVSTISTVSFPPPLDLACGEEGSHKLSSGCFVAIQDPPLRQLFHMDLRIQMGCRLMSSHIRVSSSHGRALASHARGTRIDTSLIHFLKTPTLLPKP
jgi:hypothetical protein